MSDVPDLSLFETLQQMGPWIKTALGGLSVGIGWCVRWVMRQFAELRTRIEGLEQSIPEKYATKPDVEKAVRDVGQTLQLHVDTIRTDVSRIERAMVETQTDIKGLLKLLIEDGKR